MEIGSTLASTSNTVVNGRLFAYRTTAGGNPGFRCYGTSTDQNYIQIDSTGGGLTALGINGSVGAELGTGTTAYATVLGSYVNVPVEIVVNNAKVASFASTGLSVAGTLGVTGVATLGNGAILGTPASGTVTNLTGTASININGTVGATTANTGAFTSVTTTGSVGIGTASPSSALHIYVPNAALAYFESTSASGPYAIWRVSGTSFGDIGSKLGIQGSGNNTDFMVASRSGPLVLGTGGTERMRIDSSGIVTMNAYGAGAATFSAAGVISSVSDETWKVKDGAPVDTDAMLNKLEPGYWYYNDEKKETFGKDRQLGFYAQNVNAAIGPEAAPEPETFIKKNKDGTETTIVKPWGYYDRSVLAVAVMSLQKALTTIESLTARIAALESK